MEFGDDPGGFTMRGTGFDKPGIAVTNPYNKQPAVSGNGNMSAIAANSRAKVDEIHAKALELGGTCEGPPGLRGEEGPEASTAPISGISTAISSPPSASVRPISAASGGRGGSAVPRSTKSREIATAPSVPSG